VKPNVFGEPLLSVKHLFVDYSGTPVLQDVSLCLWPHQIVSIVGSNGAGKTTILKAIGGLIRPVQGRIVFEGEVIDSLPVQEIVQRGIVYVPEGMSVFPQMSVLENLEVGAYLNRSKIPERLEMVFDLFPELRDKRKTLAGTLSGGQKRMVTLARGLMAGARLLLLDDPFLGLSPKITDRFCDAFRSIKRSEVTLFIAGQHVRRILNVANLAFLIEDGSITLSGPGPEVLHNDHLQQVLFGARTTDSQKGAFPSF
jgi:branched-chain amino acid transport system ATP-binding protein